MAKSAQCSHQLLNLSALKALLNTVSDDIHITAHVDEQARILAPLYANKVMEGRRASLEAEMSLAKGKDWWGSALALRGGKRALLWPLQRHSAPRPVARL